MLRDGGLRASLVIVPALDCSWWLHFCDMDPTLIWIDVSFHSDEMSFVALKSPRIIHIPGSSVGHKRQFPAVCPYRAKNGREPDSFGSMVL